MSKTELHPESVSERVISAVARREGVEPVALSTPLFDAVDPDALDALFDTDADTVVSVTFEYSGYRVTADSEGSVSVTKDSHTASV